MLDKFFLLFFDIALVTVYAFVGLAIFLIIQLISYRIFKKNPYKWLRKKF